MAERRRKMAAGREARCSRCAPMLAALGAVVLATAPPCRAVVSISAGADGQGVVINTLLGADAFYQYNILGQFAVVANIEAGLIWNGHESTNHITTNIFNPAITGTQLGQYDYHATAVGMTIGGRGELYYYQAGIAPYATVWSGSIATQYNADGSFNTTDPSFVYPYVQAMLVPRTVEVPLGNGISYTFNKPADIVNSSWGFEESAGSAFETKVIDALVTVNATTFVVSAGNSGPAGNTVGGPATGYNKIAVAALASDNTAAPYLQTAGFSSRGLSDFYNPRTGQTIVAVRSTVDIAAPGEALALAYYGGATGSNTGGTDDSNGAIDWYWTNAGGTSFSAPIVAGGAALLVDVGHGYLGGYSTDARVIKAVLLNSAKKTPGWSNGQALVNGVMRTTRGLDAAVGAGRMDLARALEQYINGTLDLPGSAGGHVPAIGWDLGNVAKDAPNRYVIDNTLLAGEILTVTLDWFVHRTFTDPMAGSTDPTLIGSAGGTVTDDRFDNLNLRIWKAVDGEPSVLLADSTSQYNNVEHLYYTIPEDGQYLIEVVWAGRIYDLADAGTVGPSPQNEDYAIAWYVPEPSSAVMLGIIAGFGLLRRRQRRA